MTRSCPHPGRSAPTALLVSSSPRSSGEAPTHPLSSLSFYRPGGEKDNPPSVLGDTRQFWNRRHWSPSPTQGHVVATGVEAGDGTCSSLFPGQTKQIPNPLRPSTSLCCPTHQSPAVPLTWVLSLWHVQLLAKPLPAVTTHQPTQSSRPAFPGGSPGTPGLGLFLASIQLLFPRAGPALGAF